LATVQGFLINDFIKKISEMTELDSAALTLKVPATFTDKSLCAFIEKNRASGGVIRIVKTENGKPLGFSLKELGRFAQSGDWKNHLPKANWILVFYERPNGLASVWVGLKQKAEPTSNNPRNKGYIFYLSAVSNELFCGLSFAELTGFAPSEVSVRYLLQTVRKPTATNSESKDLADIEKRLKNRKITSTTAQRLIDARLGQGRFRKDLIKVWGSKCAVSEITHPAVLRASHILAWRKATDEQRLDPYNGVLLSANFDALFDRHLISFEKDGKMCISSSVDADERAKLGIPLNLRFIPESPDFRTFLAAHLAEMKLVKKRG
jgi:HNH endonuclease